MGHRHDGGTVTMTQEIIEKLRVERDRYKAALEKIAGMSHLLDKYDMGLIAKAALSGGKP